MVTKNDSVYNIDYTLLLLSQLITMNGEIIWIKNIKKLMD